MGKAHKKLYNWQNILSPPHYRNGVHHPVEIICLYCGRHRDVLYSLSELIGFSLTGIVEQIGQMWSVWRVSKPLLHIIKFPLAVRMRTVLIIIKLFTILSII